MVYLKLLILILLFVVEGFLPLCYTTPTTTTTMTTTTTNEVERERERENEIERNVYHILQYWTNVLYSSTNNSLQKLSAEYIYKSIISYVCISYYKGRILSVSIRASCTVSQNLNRKTKDELCY